MKKYGILTIAFLLSLTMTACMGRNNTNDITGTTGNTTPMPTVVTTMPTTEPVMPDTSFYPDDDGFIGETDGTDDTTGQAGPQARMRIGNR